MYKKFLQLLFAFGFFFLIVLNASSQPYGWFSQTSGTSEHLNDVYFVNNNTGYIVGNLGTILKTINGGANWFTQVSGYPNHLFGIYFVSSTKGFIVGDGGIKLKTNNGGNSWYVLSYANTYTLLKDVYFINSNTGVAVGWYGKILHTVNGGSSWSIRTSGTTLNLKGLYFKDSNTGIIVGVLGKFLMSTNSGSIWSNISCGTSRDLDATCFVNSSKILVLGEAGNMRKSTNSGSSWSNQSSSTSRWLSDISFYGYDEGTIVGDYGTIRRSTNTGSSWIGQTSNTSDWLHGVHFTDTLIGTVVGDNGTIRRTTTGGWLLPTRPNLTSPSNNATCISPTHKLDWNSVYAPTATYRVQVATDNGFSNVVVDVSGLTSSHYNLPTGSLSNNIKYYWKVIATNFLGNGPWSYVRCFTTKPPTPGNITLVNPPNGAMGVTLTALLNWNDATSTTSYRVQLASDSLFVIPNLIIDSSGITVSEFTVPGGMLDNTTKYYWRVKGSNSCQSSSWTSIWNFMTTNELPIAPALFSPTFGAINVPENPHMTWQRIASAESYRLQIATDTTFSTLVLDTSGLENPVFDVHSGVLSGITWYYWRVNATNEVGTGPWSEKWIFRTDGFTGLFSNNIVPEEFNLLQNYPNPFNPLTNIVFDIPSEANVKLIVYDYLGREITVLIDQNLNPGQYRYRWNARDYASGVYFYRLITKEYNSTKRMILVK